MPVPVSPRKVSSQEDVPQASTPGRWMPQPLPESASHPHPTNTHHPIIPHFHPASNPQVSNRVQPSIDAENQAHRDDQDITDPDVVAGYQDCLKETLRFLLEEENLSANHPVVLGLAQHLTRQHAHVELTKVTQQIAQELPQRQQNMAPSILTPPSSPTINRGFEVTLVEDNSSSDTEDMDLDEEDDDYIDEEDMTEQELEETEQLLTDPEFRRQLLKMMYQGCDLVAAPSHSTQIVVQQ